MTKLQYLRNYCYLNENEAKILSLKDFGYSFTDISEKMDITKSRVGQVYRLAKRKIEKYGISNNKFFNILSIEYLDIAESIKNTLLDAGVYTIPDLFIIWKNGRLNNIKGLGPSGIDKIVYELHERSLSIKISSFDYYIPNDLTEIECRVFLLFSGGISYKDIRKEVFYDNISLQKVTTMVLTAAEKCRTKECSAGYINELVLPPELEYKLLNINIDTVDRLIKFISSENIYKTFKQDEVDLIYKSLDRRGYGYYR